MPATSTGDVEPCWYLNSAQFLHSSVILGQGLKEGFLEEGQEERAFHLPPLIPQGPEQKGLTNEPTHWRGCPLGSGGRIGGMKGMRLRKK